MLKNKGRRSTFFPIWIRHPRLVAALRRNFGRWWRMMVWRDCLVGPLSPNDEAIGPIGARVLWSRVGGLTGLQQPSCQTWHFGQMNGPLPYLGHLQTYLGMVWPHIEVIEAQTSGEDACSPDGTKGVWAKLQRSKTFEWPYHSWKNGRC